MGSIKADGNYHADSESMFGSLKYTNLQNVVNSA